MNYLTLQYSFRAIQGVDKAFLLSNSNRFVADYVRFSSSETMSKPVRKATKESRIPASKELIERCELEGSKVYIDSGNGSIINDVTPRGGKGFDIFVTQLHKQI